MSVSVIFARGLAGVVERRGFGPEDFLRRSNVDSTRLGDLRERLSLDDAHLLVHNAMTLLDDPALGLTTGLSAPENMLQVFGHLVLAQRTIRDAFVSLRRFSCLLAEGIAWGLEERGELALVSYEPVLQLPEAARCEVEFVLMMTERVGRHFSPLGHCLREVHLQYPAPSYAARYQESFGCPARFDMPTNALLFPRELLDHPQPHADDTVRDMLHQAAERLLQEREQARSVVDSVRALLSYQPDLGEIDVERIARQVGLSVRSLRRRLGAEGMPLSTLVDEARCQLACRELRRPESTIRGVSELLGFSEQSAFQRAFKRWTNRTPAEYARLSDAELAVQQEQARRASRAGHPAAHMPPASRRASATS